MTLTTNNGKKRSRIQQQNRRLILGAALDVFSAHGYRGATLDLIAEASGLSKPNILYYFAGKEEIHVTLLNQLMESWLEPLVELNPEGDPVEEILTYVRRKIAMARDLPRESRLFANEILQGAPRMGPHLKDDLKPLFDDKCAVIQDWIDAGLLPRLDPHHLIFSIWATTQHYADFEAQIAVLVPGADATEGADGFLDQLYRRLLSI